MNERIGGLTLLELLVTLAIVSLVAALGAPALAGFMADARRAARTNELVAGIHLARQTAIRRAEQVVMCRSRDGLSCIYTGTWSDGWLVFVNLDRDSPARIDAGEPILRFAKTAGNGAVRANRRAFTFRPFRLRATNGTFVICDRRGSAAARAVIVSVTGRPRVAARTARGRPLKCT